MCEFNTYKNCSQDKLANQGFIKFFGFTAKEQSQDHYQLQLNLSVVSSIWVPLDSFNNHNLKYSTCSFQWMFAPQRRGYGKGMV